VNKLTFYSAIFAAALFNAQAENKGTLNDGYIPMGNDNLMQETPNDYGCRKVEDMLSAMGSNNNSIALEAEYRPSMKISTTKNFKNVKVNTNRIKKIY